MSLKIFEKYIKWSEVFADHIIVTNLEEEATFSEISPQFINQISHLIDWDALSKNSENLDEKFLDLYSHLLNFKHILRDRKLSLDFIRNHGLAQRNEWDSISKHQELTSEFMEEFQDLVNFDLISKYQKLSENFIRKFRKKLNLEFILKFQKIPSSLRDELETQFF
ncbi:unnamed protein product [Bemisia tabaci]|uniref:Uncharacterized protein n=1 Tax=Bemisia tabaci TaxID=7038 RepID=A0A9P0F2Q1_BEMTA|nr:unnamed protein product [Bemisia tabaci]